MNNTAAKEGASSCRTKERDRSILSNSKFGDPRRFVRNYFPFLFLLTFHRVFSLPLFSPLSLSFLFPGFCKMDVAIKRRGRELFGLIAQPNKSRVSYFYFFLFLFSPDARHVVIRRRQNDDRASETAGFSVQLG